MMVKFGLAEVLLALILLAQCVYMAHVWGRSSLAYSTTRHGPSCSPR